MDLPCTKLPMIRNALIKDGRIEGEVDFSCCQDPFEIYEKKWLSSSHLEFADLKNEAEQVIEFIEKWGLFLKSAVIVPKKNSDRLWPTILSLSHKLHREFDPLDSALFSIELEWIYFQIKQLKAVIDLCNGCMKGEPEYLREVLSQWLKINKSSLKYLICDPLPLPLPSSTLKKALVQIEPQYLHTIGQAAVVRSFKYKLSSMSLHSPFLCIEPIFEPVAGSKYSVVTGNRMHYHVNDLFSAMWFMAYVDFTRSQSRLYCPVCNKAFETRKRNKKHCSSKCANTARQRRFQDKNKKMRMKY